MIQGIIGLNKNLETYMFWREQFAFFGVMFDYYSTAIIQVVQGLF